MRCFTLPPCRNRSRRDMIGKKLILASVPVTAGTGAVLFPPGLRAVASPVAPVTGDPGLSIKWVITFCVAHMGLALLLRNVRPLGAVHAIVTLAFGLSFCLRKNQPLQIAHWAAYVVGAEVLWRMCKAAIPWEFAKHSISLVCIISMVRAKGIRGSWLPALYFGLLFPAIFVPVFWTISKPCPPLNRLQNFGGRISVKTILIWTTHWHLP